MKTILVACAAQAMASAALAQAGAPAAAPQAPAAIYLECSSPNDPPGLHDLHLDLSRKLATDSFGTTQPLREEGPHLIVDTFVETSGARELVATRRINRFTLAFQYAMPAQKILKTGQCSKVEKKL